MLALCEWNVLDTGHGVRSERMKANAKQDFLMHMHKWWVASVARRSIVAKDTYVCLRRHPADTNEKLGLTGTTDFYLSFVVAHYLRCVRAATYENRWSLWQNVMYGRIATKCHLSLLAWIGGATYTHARVRQEQLKWIMHKNISVCVCERVEVDAHRHPGTLCGVNVFP